MASAPVRAAPHEEALQRDPARPPAGGPRAAPRLPLPLLAAGLGVATALSRLPFRSHSLFSWDSANFALALDQYNVALHQPQPPGYPLYVASAALVRGLLGEANASYVALSVVASGLAVCFLTLAAARLFGRPVALLAAVLLATSSVFWSQGEVAYPYAFLALFSSLLAWLCAAVRDGVPSASRLTVLGGVLLGVGAGFRSELLPFLAPLWVYAALRRPLGSDEAGRGFSPLLGSLARPGRGPRGAPTGRTADWAARLGPLVAGGALLALVVLLWYVPMVQRSGGWAAYQAATGSYYAYFIQTTSGAGKLLLGLLENTRAVVGYLYNGLGLALLPVLYFLGRTFAPQRIVSDRRVRFLLLWLLPPLAFYVTVHIGNPGYVLSFLPALCVSAAVATLGLFADLGQATSLVAARRRGAGRAGESPAGDGAGADGPPEPPSPSRSPDADGVPALLGGPSTPGGWVVPAAGAFVLLCGAANVLLFLLATGEGRYQEIRQIDRILSRQVAYVRAGFPAESTILFAYDRSRQYHYYLPRHRIELLFDVAVAGAVTDTSRYWERRRELVVPPGVAAVLFPDLGRNTSDQPGLVEHVDLGDGVDLYLARVHPGDAVRYGYQYASATRGAG